MSGFKQLTCWRDRIGPAMKKSRKIKGGNYVQIATVERVETRNSDGTSSIEFQPRNRTVVFRGFEDGIASSLGMPSNLVAMAMITDR